MRLVDRSPLAPFLFMNRSERPRSRPATGGSVLKADQPVQAVAIDDLLIPPAPGSLLQRINGSSAFDQASEPLRQRRRIGGIATA
jgi:hypothetical protein